MNHASKMSVAITFLASIAALSSAMAEDAKPVESTANPTARKAGVELYVERAQHESTANPTARTAGAESPEAQRIAFEAALKKANLDIGNDPKARAAIVRAIRDKDMVAVDHQLERWFPRKQLTDAKISFEDRTRGQPLDGANAAKVKVTFEGGCCPLWIKIVFTKL